MDANQLFIEKISLNNFRNLNNQLVEFNPGINCIFGNNGNGKTNLLEAVYYLSSKKSFRKKTGFQQIINIECEEPQIILSSLYSNIDKTKKIQLSGKIDSQSSQWYLDNKPFKSKIELKSIFINPFDSFLFHTTASFRRTWFDQHLSLLSKEYKRELSDFNKSLRFRNTLLSKKPYDYKNQIKSINEKLAQNSYNLINFKKNLIAELNSYITTVFKEIFDEMHVLEIEIESKFYEMQSSEILDFYNTSIEKDSIIGHTTTGVHRDDYLFNFDGFNSFEYCSLGQQKMSFLSLLFAYIELFRYKFKTYPIVLIDDVSGELDHQRWQNLISFLMNKKFQVLITTANENFKRELEKIDSAKMILVTDGNYQNI